MGYKLDITKNGFFIDGKEYRMMSGAVHYFRVVPEYWRDRLQKLKACGLNTVETYIAWNMQEPAKDCFRFDGMADFEKFLDISAELGLYAIVRPGPYICAEWEMGGLPGWLNEIDGIQMRRFNKPYLERVDKYFDEIIPRLIPRLSTNGGNIIAMQVENEYGGLGISDTPYLEYLRNGLIRRGVDVPLFTSDGTADGKMGLGRLDGVFMTANFGSRYQRAFGILKEFQPDLPPVCMELWNAWFDQWGRPHHTREPQSVADEVSGILECGGGFNLYMFHGGTNFGFMNGSNCDPLFDPTITSYDYGASLNEYGDYTETYMAIREVLKKYSSSPLPELPPRPVTRAYEDVKFTGAVSLFDALGDISSEYKTDKPYNMEHFGQMHGYILYTADVSGMEGALSVGEPRDRVLVYIDGKYAGLLERDGKMDSIYITDAKELKLLVENMSRVNYGERIYDKKGMAGEVTIGGTIVEGFTVNCLPMDKTNFNAGEFKVLDCPALYKGTIHVDEPHDTFIKPDGFTKGVILVNGFNIGRYWSIGPQLTYYIPAPLLKSGENEIIIFDLYPSKNPHASLNAEHELG